MASMIISVALLISAVMAFVIFGGSTNESELIKEDQYQAVFLNDQNGQVYFGKLSLVNSKFYRLTDIFMSELSKFNQTPAKQPKTLAWLN